MATVSVKCGDFSRQQRVVRSGPLPPREKELAEACRAHAYAGDLWRKSPHFTETVAISHPNSPRERARMSMPSARRPLLHRKRVLTPPPPPNILEGVSSLFFLCVAWKLCGEKYWGGAGGGETARALAQVVLLRVVVVVRLVAAAALAALVRALFCVRLFFACWCDAACASSHEADGARSAEEGERAREDKEEEEHGDDKRDDEVEATEAPQDEVRSVGIVATAAPKT
eukprot:2209702-Rhodomonas_salina.1